MLKMGKNKMSNYSVDSIHSATDMHFGVKPSFHSRLIIPARELNNCVLLFFVLFFFLFLLIKNWDAD